MLKGVTDELTTAGGKQLGKTLAAKLIEKLMPIADQTQLKESDTKQLLKLADQQQKALDDIRATLTSNLRPREFEQLLDTSVIYERVQIRTHLKRNGFTDDKADLHSDRLVQRLQQELKAQ